MARLGRDNFIDQPVLQRLLRGHEEITIRVFLRLSTRQHTRSGVNQRHIRSTKNRLAETLAFGCGFEEDIFVECRLRFRGAIHATIVRRRKLDYCPLSQLHDFRSYHTSILSYPVQRRGDIQKADIAGTTLTCLLHGCTRRAQAHWIRHCTHTSILSVG